MPRCVRRVRALLVASRGVALRRRRAGVPALPASPGRGGGQPMIRRRDWLKLGLAGGRGGPLARTGRAGEARKDLLKFLCPPDGEPPDLATASPPVRPFVGELFVPPIKQPVARLDPPPDPRAHQRYEEFRPQKF